MQTGARCAPEGDGGDAAHESVGRDALQVEEHAVEQQQQHDVLRQSEGALALPHQRQVLRHTHHQLSASTQYMCDQCCGRLGA